MAAHGAAPQAQGSWEFPCGRGSAGGRALWREGFHHHRWIGRFGGAKTSPECPPVSLSDVMVYPVQGAHSE